MMDLYISEINHFKGYRYQDGEIELTWSIEGIVLGEKMDACEINGERFSGGETIPWSVLHPGSQPLFYREEEIPIQLRRPADINTWLRFIKGFPKDIRLKACQAYFGKLYLQGVLNGTLSDCLFTDVLETFPRLNLGTNNPEVTELVRQWENRFHKFLIGELVNADIDKNPRRIIDITTRIKNHFLKEEYS